MSHFDSSNDQRDPSVTNSDIITEPYHGFEQQEEPFHGNHILETSGESHQSPSRTRKKPLQLIEDLTFLSHADMDAIHDEIFEPQTYQEAMVYTPVTFEKFK